MTEFIKEVPLGVYYVNGVGRCGVHGCSNNAATMFEFDARNTIDGFALPLCHQHLQDLRINVRDVFGSV